MKCDECGKEIDNKGVILDHFGRPVKTGDVILFMLPTLRNVITVEGAEIKLKEPITSIIPVAMVVQETECRPLSDVGEWTMTIQGFHPDSHPRAAPLSQIITGQNYKPHPDVYQLGAKIHEVF
jgi:hypothetical protein